ncbi:MAG: hypothetical protein H7175_06845, partial [Burkholderiales bacterium]|nr:hypothetical protein [Anaerolineae bacterium]
ALLLIVIGGLALITLGWVSVVAVGNRVGWFDLPTLAPISDERILSNVRDDLENRALLDGVVHLPDDQLYLSQAGGTLYSYDPETQVWNDETPFAPDAAVSQDFAALRSGCGAERGANVPCADADSLWALGSDGSLARRTSNGWQIVVANTALTTLDGEPITQDQLTSAAVASDSQWLVVGTRENGIGIYNSAQHRWLETTINADLNALSITKIVWWDGYFWIATPQGLGRLTISDSEPIFEPVANSANVIDLDLDPTEENLWVLERRACANDRADESCTWLGVIDNADNLDAEPQTIINEQNHYADLDLTSVNFAQQISDDLFLAGDAGLYQYGIDTHTWERLFSRPVSATLPQNESFFYAGAGRIGQISAQEPQQWTFANHDVLQLLADRPNEVLALANSDDEITALVSLSTQSGAFTPIFDGGGTHYDPASFTQAVALGDTVLFLGEGRGTFHNTRTRAYDDLPTEESGVPEWLSSANTRLLTSGEIVYGIVSNGRRSADIYPLPISLLQEAANFTDGTVAAVESITLNTGIDQQWAWGENRIGVLGTNGVVSFIDSTTTPPVIDVAGAAEVGLIGFSPRDAAVLSNALVLTDGAQILAYDVQRRGWLEINNPIPDMPIKQLLSLEDQIFLLTDDGRLIDPNEQTLIGGGPFTIPDEAISDALVDDAGAFLYLAGNGIVEPYDLTARQVREGWNVPGAGDVLIENTVDGQPLVLTESFAALGERAILPTAGAVLELSYDEASRTIWTLRQGEDHPYVMSHPVGQLDDLSARTCLFRQTSAGADVQRVFDARTPPNGLVIVGTNAGIKFYSPTARSWYDSTLDESAEDLRLYTLDNYLLTVSQTSDGEYALAFVDANMVNVPHSCSIGQISLTQEFTAQSVAVAVDEGTGRAAWLDEAGHLIQWSSGTTETLLTESEDAPETENFRRVYNRQAAGYVLFTTESELWLYDLRQRVWRPITLSLPENALNVTIVDLNAERSRGNEIITARMSDGSFYYGLFVPSGDEVALVPVYAPVVPDDRLPDDIDLDTLVDVQERASDGSVWTLLLNDRVLYFNTGPRTWSQTTTRFPADDTLEFQRGAGVGVVIGDNENSWWIGEGAGEHPLRFTRYEPTVSDQAAALDGGSQVWRLTERGEVQVCRAGAGATDDAEDDLYTCDIFYSPFIINPADVFHAFEWGEAVLLETTTGLRAFDVEQGIETPLTAEIAAFNSINASLEIDDHLFLYSDSRDTLLVLAEDLSGAVFEISDLRQDQDGRLWARFVDGWRYYSNGDFVAANAGLSVFPASGGPVTALDTAGRLYRWQNSRFVADPLPLPQSITPTNINFALQDVDGDWWLLADEQLQHVIREECVSDSALYPLSTEVARQTETAIPLATESANATRAAATLAAETTEEATEAVQSARLITLDDIVATAASLSPANTPTPIPCLFTSETVSADGITDVVSVSVERGALELVDRSGRVFRVDTDTLTTDTSDQPERVPAFALDDDWDSLSANVVTLPDGQTAYDPVIALEHPATETPEALQIRRVSGITATIAERGAFPDEFELPRALNAGWLRWSRRSNDFTLETSDGPTAYPPDALIVDGEFLFEDVNALLALNIDAFHAANRYGLWRYSTPTLNLNDETITFYPQTLTATAATPMTAAHRRFYSGGRVYAIRAGQLVREDVADLGFQIGDVSFNEVPLEGEISVTARLSDGTQRNVLLDDGFLWDANRRQVAFADGELLLQSDIGIHPVSRLEDFDVELDDLSTGEGILQSEGGGLFIFNPTSGVWYQRGADGWQRNVPNPLTNRELFTTPFWTWRLNNTALDITLAGEAQNFAFTTANTTFNFDNVRGAAVHNGALFVASDAFIEVANPPNNLSSPSTLRLPPLQLNRLATYHLADGTTGLYAFDGGLPYQWDGANFVPANINPDQQRPLVELPRLRLTLTGGDVLKELLVDDLNGGSSWAEFVLAEGRLPFDVVTGAQVFGDQLYLGSAAGLQIYPARTPLVLDSLATVYDMRPSPSGPLVAVERLGIPEADSSLVMVFGAETASGTACIERTLSSVFQPCADPSLLVRSLRVNNSFWRWTFDGDTSALVGQYIAVDGTLDPESISFSDGRLPHDRFDDVTVCNNRAFTLWDGRWISAYASNALSLETDNVENYLPTSRPNRLLCFEDNV